MYDGEDDLQMPALTAPALDIPMPEHLQNVPEDTLDLAMEQGAALRPEDFGSLAEVIQGAQDTHGQVAKDLGWSKAA